MMEPLVKIASGVLRGSDLNGVSAFFGVPYAAPPVGELRFAFPVPHEPWHGTRDASAPGPTAPQFSRAFPMVNILPLVGNGWRKGDDFLTANIWTSESITEKLPVAVFIHGGAWVGGSSYAPVSDGTAFARSGVVCVALNYRLGIEGFLPIPGIPTNLGLRDILAALHWVQENIASFGGDPARVTVFGESAGAMLIGNLLGSPLSKGLFQRAIIESGHASMVRSPEVAARVVDLMAKTLNITPDVAGFRSKTAEECVEALLQISQPKTRINLKDASGSDPVLGMSKVTPIFGDDVLPELPLTAIRKGASREVDVVIGTNKEEFNLYFVPTGVRKSMRSLIALYAVSRSQRRAFSILRTYGLWTGRRTPGEALSEAMTDFAFRAPARRLAAAHQGKAYVYEFGWQSPACGGMLGACHGLELPFVFDTLACCSGTNGICGENPPQTLAVRIHGLWVDVIQGRPVRWPEYDSATRTVLSLETGASASEPPLPAESFLPPL